MTRTARLYLACPYCAQSAWLPPARFWCDGCEERMKAQQLNTAAPNDIAANRARQKEAASWQ